MLKGLSELLVSDNSSAGTKSLLVLLENSVLISMPASYKIIGQSNPKNKLALIANWPSIIIVFKLISLIITFAAKSDIK